MDRLQRPRHFPQLRTYTEWLAEFKVHGSPHHLWFFHQESRVCGWGLEWSGCPHGVAVRALLEDAEIELAVTESHVLAARTLRPQGEEIANSLRLLGQVLC